MDKLFQVVQNHMEMEMLICGSFAIGFVDFYDIDTSYTNIFKQINHIVEAGSI